jgi:hypothetical protein
MGWGTNKTVLETVVVFGLCALGWVPWGLFRNLFKDDEAKTEKRKKNGIGLV